MKDAAISQHLFSGALSGFAGAVLLQPLDLLKTRIQQGDVAQQRTRNTTIIWRTAGDIVKQDGVKGLWRGTTATLMRNVPGVALYMTSLTRLRAVMAKSPYFAVQEMRETKDGVKTVLPKVSNKGNLIAGATARVAVGLLLNPFSVVKARFESGLYSYKTLTGSLISVLRSGPSESMRGVLASSLRDAPHAGLFVVLYEAVKREATFLAPNVYPTTIHSFSAASAGAIATMATHPFDVIKTKMQVRSEERYQGFISTTCRIWQQRGVFGFFDGVSLRLSRKVLGSVIGWAVFEGVLLLIHKGDQ
ncbi:solute carrier family 25 member 38 [Pisolithus croceorrhizus]|nr:solute carrier family 25 member 38 [Pisolithus croceorrhizus]KAI6095724.1 solute carrier family 25 member 38 [Pisolithus croceorrhizus]KAI6168885.1 solute carrier family 25 member 38 [Pisolithus thermaeus]